MPTAESQTISVTIDCPCDRAYAFLVAPENFPQWASGLSESLEKTEDGWVAQTPRGPVAVRFTPTNPFGVLDHAVVPAAGVEILIPMRIVPNGDGCEVLLTLIRQADMTNDQFAQDAAWVRRDLQSLKSLLEVS